MSLRTINMFLVNTSALSGTMSVKAPTPEWAKAAEKEEAEREAMRRAMDASDFPDRADRKTYVNQTQYDELVAADPSLADVLVVIHPIDEGVDQ